MGIQINSNIKNRESNPNYLQATQSSPGNLDNLVPDQVIVGSVGGSRMDLADEEEKVEERGDVGSSFKSDHNFGKESQGQEEVKFSAFA